MNAPSLKRLTSELNITTEQAKIVRQLIHKELRTDDSMFPATKAWVSSCYHKPSYIERLMECINETVNGYGVECLGADTEPYALYINTGDTYSGTILYSYKTRTFRITSWGDYAEQNNL